MNGRCYYDRMDWWTWVESLPGPRVIILQDIDHTPGLGALVGEIHATIAQSLNCAGCITNGAVRDLQAVEALGFPLFSRRVSVSHSYAHIVDFGGAVEVGGLAVQPGDLIHGDRNGVQIIPREIAADVPDDGARIQRQEEELIRFCRSDAFSLRELADAHAACFEGRPASRARTQTMNTLTRLKLLSVVPAFAGLIACNGNEVKVQAGANAAEVTVGVVR